MQSLFSLRILLAAAIAPSLAVLAAPSPGTVSPWIPDRGDGTYRNPVLFADYSDPDAVRVGDDYYLVSSSFLATPGLPILHSKDLVNWTIINHALAVQVPADHFAAARHGEGVWAPAIRFHGGRFWITYPDPDYGLYLTTATDPAGTWTPPVLIKGGRGLIDPCPFWDDDGQLYLVHGWAKSRAGISNLLTLHRLSEDGTKLLDAGEIIIDGNKIPDWNTLEGPKLYKHHGYYYVFAPSGGVGHGYQAVFRSKSLHGPYEHRNVLDQGRTPINGPHQGAWIDTPTGEDWFLHFQDLGAYGRVVHLEPMAWHDDWPVIGADPGGTGKGEPVLVHRKPDVGRVWPITVPQTSDEFDGGTLGLQWQWNANPRADWTSLSARPGFLRLASVPAPATRNNGSPAGNSLYDIPNFLLQKFPSSAFTVTTSLQFSPADEGERAGLVVFGFDYAWVGLRRTATGLRLVYDVNRGANRPGAQESEVSGIDAPASPVFLRVTVGENAICQFAFSFDNRDFTPIGKPFQASGDRWIGAKVGLFASARPSAQATGFADFNWFRVTPAFHGWAATPPMGWNSWDCFATTVTEAQTRAQAEVMKARLATHGWNLITVDIQWYEPNATGFDYRKNAKLEMDEWGRLIPAANKFPSSSGGQGFKALADAVHGLGLKFGVHLLRGVPRQAVEARTPVKGTAYTAADIADPKSICRWNGDMFGVDMAKPGAQEYYNSVFELFASWGIDFVKVDDLSEPYHLPEIEGIRSAIDHCGRAIVLSTSPGPTPVADGTHISAHANLWRISGDFWDHWPQLLAQFGRLNAWTPFRGPGHFPDADMLPLGTISMGKRRTNFTADEQVCLLSLWSIARSPLILGADLTKLDDATLALITNDEILAVDQGSTGNRELFRRDGFYGWVADVPGSRDRYLALFNTRDAGSAPVPVKLAELGLDGAGRIRDLWRRADLGRVAGEFAPSIPAHGAGLYRISPAD